MKISIIAAMAKNRVIGKNNALPWRLPSDLRHFKEITMGRTIIMGRKTYESIGKALPGRQNIVITRQPDYQCQDCLIAKTVDEAISLAGFTADEIFFIGGAQVFKKVLPKTDKIYLTIIDEDFEGDTYFPNLNPNEWIETERKEGIVDEDNIYKHMFLVLERKISR